jgi:hypothetical protein
VDLQDEINGLLDDICGELFEQTEDEKEEIKEEIKTKYADLLLYTRELLDHDLVRDEDRSILRYVAQSIERRTRFETIEHKCTCGSVYIIYTTGGRVHTEWDMYKGREVTAVRVDGFYCMDCGEGIRCTGKIHKILSADSKYEVSRRENAFRQRTKNI